MADTAKPGKGTKDTKDSTEVDPRLDNRIGEQRPYDNGIKPQQVYGGFVGDESDDEDPKSDGDPDGGFVGHGSVGPHGRGPAVGRAPGAVADGED
jgi:hypothetical protein